MKDGNFIINVKVGGFRLPLSIARKDEEIYRNAEKKVNDLLANYQQRYNQRSAEEILSITAYQLAVALSKKEFSSDAAPIAGRLEKLDEELDKLLSE